MKIKQLIGTLVAVAVAGSTGLLAGCGSEDTTTSAATPLSSVSATTSSAAAPAAQAPADLTLAPGAAGPVKVGMSKAAALATGLLTTSAPESVEGCPTPALSWIDAQAETFDLQLLEDGEIASIGVRRAGPTTADGLGVGSTLAEVLATYPGAKAVAAGYGQTGVLVRDAASDGWIGFLINAEPSDVKDTDTVTFIELTAGEKPSVMRDGC